jgi:hypothetical protein
MLKTGLFVGATAAVVISGTLVSYASWIVPGPEAAARAQAASMPGGVAPDARKVGGDAVVTWKAQEIVPGVKMTAYVVTAHDTDPTPRPSLARTVSASGSGTESVTFTAAELAGGKWKWAITPKLQSWTGAEGPLSNPKLVFPGAAPATDVAKAAPTDAMPAAAPAKVVPLTARPAETTPRPTATTSAPPREPTAEPAATSPEPEKSTSPKTDPAPSKSSSDIAPPPVGSSAE